MGQSNLRAAQGPSVSLGPSTGADGEQRSLPSQHKNQKHRPGTHRELDMLSRQHSPARDGDGHAPVQQC